MRLMKGLEGFDLGDFNERWCSIGVYKGL
jgi:hypothetical protein